MVLIYLVLFAGLLYASYRKVWKNEVALTHVPRLEKIRGRR